MKHNIILHASTTASSSSAMLEQAPRGTTTRHDSHDTSYLSCRDVTQQVDFGLKSANMSKRKTYASDTEQHRAPHFSTFRSIPVSV